MSARISLGVLALSFLGLACSAGAQGAKFPIPNPKFDTKKANGRD